MRLRTAATRFFTVPVLAFVLAACGAAEYQYGTIPVGLQPEPAEVPAEIETVHPVVLNAWRAGNLEVLKTYLTPDAVFVTPTGTYTGWTDISANWMVPVVGTVGTYTITPYSYVREGPAIIETGRYGYVMRGNGMPRHVSGSYTYRWVKTEKGWRLARAHMR